MACFLSHNTTSFYTLFIQANNMFRPIFRPSSGHKKCISRGSYTSKPGLSYITSSSFFLRWRYSPLWALACRTIPFHFLLSITNSLHLLTSKILRSFSTSSLHPFLSLPLRLGLSSSWVKIFLGILSSSILSRWPSQLILCPFIHFTIFSSLFKSSSSRFVLIFHSPSSYLGPYILLNCFLSKISRAFSSFFVIVHV
jgi:hypothetical protein